MKLQRIEESSPRPPPLKYQFEKELVALLQTGDDGAEKVPVASESLPRRVLSSVQSLLKRDK